MVHYENDLSALLSTSLADDPELVLQLQEAFLGSVAKQLDLLSRARCDGNWFVSAERLKGLAASFSAHELLLLAEQACQAAPGDPVILRNIRDWYTQTETSLKT